jgi:hypothetical protein
MKNTNTALLPIFYIEKVENMYVEYTNPISPPPASPGAAPNSQGLTNSQLVLACYYVLVSWGIHPRSNIDIAPVARFMHLVTGKPYKRVHTSEFYRKLQRVPNFKTDRGLIKDLEVVKRLFLQLELKDASLLVDRELALARQEMSIS